MEQLSGLPAAQVVGKYAPQLFAHLRDREAFDLAREALSGEAVAGKELQFQEPATGRHVWVSVRLNPYRSAEGEIIGIIAFVEDITDRKLMKEELQVAHQREDQQAEVGHAYGLSPRELTILKLVAAGKSNKEIAVALSIGPVTVSSHVKSILRKMHAASRAEAAVRAVREALVN